MASKSKVTPQKEETLEKEGPETPPDSPLLDRPNASVKALIRTAKKRGYVTHDQINSLMREVNSEQVENVLAMFSEMGINVVESEEAETEKASEESHEDPEEEESDGELVEVARTTPAETKSPASAPTIPCACTCAKWVRSSCFRAKAKSPLPSASRPAARR
jgi:RNA polymerase primary sigma factor